MGIKNWSLCIKQITNLKIAEYFLKKKKGIYCDNYISTLFVNILSYYKTSYISYVSLYLHSTLFQVNKDLFYQRITRVHKYFTAGEFVLGTLQSYRLQIRVVAS